MENFIASSLSWLNCNSPALTSISIIIGGGAFFWRSLKVQSGKLEEDFVKQFLEVTESAIIEIRTLSVLQPVPPKSEFQDSMSRKPKSGEIEVNEYLGRVWIVVQNFEALSYRAFAFSENAEFANSLWERANSMKESIKLIEEKDATGFNQIKQSIEQSRIEFLDYFKRRHWKLAKARQKFVDNENKRIKESFDGFI